MCRLAVLLALAAMACGGSPDDHNVWRGGGEAPPRGQGGAPSAVATVGNTATTSGAGGSPTSGPASSTTGSGVGGGESDTCAPEPDDLACIGCLKQECCTEIETCLQDATCQCWIECALIGFIGCEQCGQEQNAELDALLVCAEGCQLECGF